MLEELFDITHIKHISRQRIHLHAGNTGDAGSPGGGNDNLLQYSCLKYSNILA